MNAGIKITELKHLNFATRKQLLNFYNAGFPKSRWETDRLDSFFNKRGKCLCFVVEDENEIRGLAIGKKSDNDKRCMILNALLIGGNLRGNGYAKKMMELFIEKSFNFDDIAKVCLHFRDSNNLEDFYSKFGFGNHKICGTYKNGELKHYMEISKDGIIRANY